MESLSISATAALAIVAAIGFLIGRWRRDCYAVRDPGRRELRRARAIARRMSDVSERVHDSLKAHRRSVDKFRAALRKLTKRSPTPPWQDLSEEAERLLRPTQLLATELQHAYDDLRQQINMLMTFSEVRTDPLTGLSNRRAFNESLRSLTALHACYQTVFSLVIFDIDRFKQINDESGHLHGDQILQRTARLIDENARETDIVTRYGGEEFVVVMPETNFVGACVFAERLRRQAEARLPVTLSGGVATAHKGDGPDDVVLRADQALYAAKARGRNRVCTHNGREIADAPALNRPASFPALAGQSSSAAS
jgi:diguanylate cyclase (GGDEF)-like protein